MKYLCLYNNCCTFFTLNSNTLGPQVTTRKFQTLLAVSSYWIRHIISSGPSEIKIQIWDWTLLLPAIILSKNWKIINSINGVKMLLERDEHLPDWKYYIWEVKKIKHWMTFQRGFWLFWVMLSVLKLKSS